MKTLFVRAAALVSIAFFSFGTLANETRVESSKRLMLAAISPVDGAPGSVIASPSRRNPDYYYHWVRDSALVMNVVVTLAETASSAGEKQRYLGILADYAQFSRRNQLTPNRSGSPQGGGLGEPKFMIDGSSYNGDWGRPQNDGPALRALTMIRYAKILIDMGRMDEVAKLYRKMQPADSLIKTDLEYVSHHWQDPSFDLWEEVLGDHFYTRLVQRRALLEGADLADRFGDTGAASWYRIQASHLEPEIEAHWDSSVNYLRVTRNRVGGGGGKESGLDVGTLLGVLHAGGNDHFFAANDDRVLATASALESRFVSLYEVNSANVFNLEFMRRFNLTSDLMDFTLSEGAKLAPAIGRYPEDHYDGYVTTGLGNPWFLATHAFAELYYRAANAFEAQGYVTLTKNNRAFIDTALQSAGAAQLSLQTGEKLQAGDARLTTLLRALRERGNQFMNRTAVHAGPGGSMSEQIQRQSGLPHGASDLTWSFASLLTATWAR